MFRYRDASFNLCRFYLFLGYRFLLWFLWLSIVFHEMSRLVVIVVFLSFVVGRVFSYDIQVYRAYIRPMNGVRRLSRSSGVGLGRILPILSPKRLF
jgi:hypothetical protein